MDYRLIELFKVATPVKKGRKKNPIELNKIAVKFGYIIHPDVCNKFTEEFLQHQTVDYNSTFYKKWDSVKNDSERLIDQLTHYACAYTLDKTWVPEVECEIPEYRSYTVIMPCTEEALLGKCMDMICSGIAMKSVTTDVLCEYIIEYCNGNQSIKNQINIDEIKNKEAQVKICRGLKVTPKDKFALLRYIVYCVTGSAELINNKEFKSRMFLGKEYDMTILTQDQLISLSSIFNRYKYVFMSLKANCPKNKIIINKISRLSKKYHTPMKVGFWENVLVEEQDIDVIISKLNEINNFKIIKLLQAIKENIILYLTNGNPIYIIRNGKCFVSTDKTKNTLRSVKGEQMYNYWKSLYCALYETLAERLSVKKCVVRFDDNLNLACPTSEKNFIGDIPFGSYFNMTKNNIVGIYWRNEWGARDLDLSFCDYGGIKYGWNSYWTREDRKIIFSGDMVNADPEASELILFKNDAKKDGIIHVNIFDGMDIFNGMDECMCKFMIAQDNEINPDKFDTSYMVDPNNIKVSTEIKLIKNDTMLGFIQDGKVYICSIPYKNNIVSKEENLMKDIFKRKADSFIDLRQLLLMSGFELYNPEIHKKIDLDLTNLKRDTLIELFN